MIPLEKQNRYRRLYGELRPGYRHSGQVYEGLLASRITPESRVLDAGCGRAGVIGLYKDKVKQAVGLDVDMASLRDNVGLDQLVMGDLNHMPFADGCFDIVLCTWVVEHLEEPDLTFAELSRVLAKGGHLLILTPNAWNYVVLINRLIRGRLQPFLARKVYGRREADTFPAFYRANTKSKLDEKLGRVGLRDEEFHHIGDPTYIAFNDLFFKLGMFLERLMDLRPLRSLKVHLVASYVKT